MRPLIQKTIIAIAIVGTAIAIILYTRSIHNPKVSPEALRVIADSNPKSIHHDPNIIQEFREDGIRILWENKPDSRIIFRSIYKNNLLLFKSLYRLDTNGNPLICKIYDDQHNEIYKISYGYRRPDGMLVEERVFDSSIKNTNDLGVELPIRRYVYVDDLKTPIEAEEGITATVEYPQLLQGRFRNPFIAK